MPMEARQEKAEQAVIAGAKLADVAVREFQFRLWAQQQDGQQTEPDRAEKAIDQFTEWLEQSRPQRKRRVRRAQ